MVGNFPNTLGLYGEVVRIAPDELSIISEDIWRQLYVKPKPQYLKDPYTLARPLNGGHSLFTAEQDDHKRIKGCVVRGLSDRMFKGQSPVVEEHASRLVTRLRHAAADSDASAVEIWKTIGDTTLDMITNIAISDTFLGPGGGDPSEEIASFIHHARFSTLMNSLSRWPLLKFGFIFGYARLGAKLRFKTWKVGIQKIERRRLREEEEGADLADLASPLVPNVGPQEKGHGLSKAEFYSNLLSFIFASSLLTTATITTTMYFVSRYIHTFHELKKEIRARFTDEDSITVDATQDLPYLDCVIKETLRLQHPTPISLPRLIDSATVIDGYAIPPHTIVGTHLQAIQTSSRYWTEPLQFNPERFLPQSDSRYDPKFSKDNRGVFHPFSIGVRGCVGERVFAAQAKVAIAKLVWNFDFELEDDNDWTWPDQKAYLIFEPKALRLQLSQAL